MTSTASEDITRQAIDAFYRAIEQRSVESLRKVVTPDWEYIPEPAGVAPGPDQMIPVFADIAAALPDMKVTILDLLVHGDRVAVRHPVISAVYTQ